MMPISLLLAIAAQAAVAMPPPIFIPASRRASGPIVTMDVEVRGGGEVLWNGQLRVSDRTGASFTRQQSGATPTACAGLETYGDTSERSSLSVNLSTVRQATANASVEIRVSWDRPSGDSDCASRRSTRSVGIVETVSLEPGRDQTISGDGGLSIRLRRR